ncbi:peptide chain release factor-like protein [Pseudomonas sp. Leaf127]|uniref:peptide chain release factor H n=1 Tax=Pseudomonas TaxID=286 RepID=UPI0007027EA7|nr:MULTISPECIES: peptide chain release factor H [Pseudomonas]KQQ55965.1 peptide chain release factor-like protein [Pseudomonas sp. Leaf127]
MILLQLSSAQGPAECERAVAKALQRLEHEARACAVSLSVVEQQAGQHGGTLRSVLLCLEGEQAQALASQWHGNLCWVCASPYRPGHRRKNWYFGAEHFSAPQTDLSTAIRFETTRSGGPGGQHVNTTDSAVRATHVASGITVKVQSERSQHANKRLAVMLIGQRLQTLHNARQAELKTSRHLSHQRVERGNAGRRFVGEDFIPA